MKITITRASGYDPKLGRDHPDNQDPTLPPSDGVDKARIQVLWFDSEGRGPDELAFQLHSLPAELDGRIPAYLGIRVRAGDIVIVAGTMVDGGFNLDRGAVVELHRQIGAWLAGFNLDRGAVVELHRQIGAWLAENQ